MNTVDNLTKVSLRLEAGTTAEQMDLTPDPSEFTFILGIAADGMCPFEYQLINKNVGEIVLLHLNKEVQGQFFGHIHLPVLDLFKKNDSLFLKVSILKIEKPDSKEVVKALAESTAHPGGCGCGCGC